MKKPQVIYILLVFAASLHLGCQDTLDQSSHSNPVGHALESHETQPNATVRFLELKSDKLPEDVRMFIERSEISKKQLHIMFLLSRDKSLVFPEFKIGQSGKMIFEGKISGVAATSNSPFVHRIDCMEKVSQKIFEADGGFSLIEFKCERK